MEVTRRRQVSAVAMVSLVLAVSFLHLPDSGGDSLTTQSHLVLDDAKDAPVPPASPREYFGNGSLHHVSNENQDLEIKFDKRHRVLLQGCKLHDARMTLPNIAWRLQHRVTLRGQVTFCLPPKVGSSSFRRVCNEIKDLIPATHQPVEVMIVRHPLARLASAYRDKFLNGNPIHKYNKKWRNITQSIQSWNSRFLTYWMPALISTGALTQTTEFKEMLHKIREAYVAQTERMLWHPTVQEKKFYGKQVMNIFHGMLHSGPYTGIIKTCQKNYNITDTIKRFKNASFTFSQFLRHVVWTYEQGMPNSHWMTYTENCNPCRMRPDYILKLETVQEEINHLFHHVLGFPENISFPVRHRSVGHSLERSDRQYYANVSPELMQNILHIYRHDFALFGYKHDVY